MSMIISLVTFLILLLIVNLMTSFMWGIPHFWSRLIWSPYSPNHPIALNWGKFQFRPTALTSQLELCSIAKYMNRSFGSIQWETKSLFRIPCDKRILFITRIWTRTLQLGSYATPMAQRYFRHLGSFSPLRMPKLTHVDLEDNLVPGTKACTPSNFI